MALPQFKNEVEFRRTWIQPFLTKLGFILVTHSHGTDEQGKDFFFADFDKFEHPRFHAVQAKNGDIGSGGSEIGDLLGQVKAAFEVRIVHRKGADEQRISSVYIMASGRISSEARRRISEHCRGVPYGENVHYLDGDRLEALEKFAHYRTDRDVRSVLLALDRELAFNLRHLRVLQLHLDDQLRWVYSHLRLAAMESVLSGGIPPDLLPLHEIEAAWNALDLANGTADFARSHPITTDNGKANWKFTMTEAVKWCEKLREQVNAALRQLDDRYSLSVEIPK